MMRLAIVTTLLALLAGAMVGCAEFRLARPSGRPSAADTAPTPRPDPARDYAPKAAIQSNDTTPTAIQQALHYAEQYMKASEQVEQLRTECRRLEKQADEMAMANGALKANVATLTKELDQANLMVRELDGEIKKWKQDVLGFRRQTLDGQEATLRGINMVLKILNYDAPAHAIKTPAPAGAAVGGKGS